MDKRAGLLCIFLQKQNLSHILIFVILWLKNDGSFLFHLHFFGFFSEVISFPYLLLTYVFKVSTLGIFLGAFIFFSLTYKNSLCIIRISSLCLSEISQMYFPRSAIYLLTLFMISFAVKISVFM